MGRTAGEDMTAPDSLPPKTHQPDGVEFRLLGPVGIWAGEKFLGPATPQQRSVLAMLLLHAGRTVPLERLMKAVWDQEPPASARNAVQGYVSKLRRLLARVPGTELSTSPPGYRLVLDPARVDLLRFRELVARAHASDQGRACDLLRQALVLWHGPPLADVAGGLLRDTFGVTLEEERLSTIEERLAICLRLGRHHEALVELPALVSEHPLRERLVHLTMVALHRDGRRAAALAAYHDLRGRLVEELGIDPGSELQQLYQRLLEEDDLAEAGDGPATVLHRGDLSAGGPGGVPAPPVPAELPADLVSFTGRGAELARAYETLRATESGGPRICQITGLGGVGKSSLAIHIAHAVAGDFPDGQLYINLHGDTPHTRSVKPAEAMRRFLRSLGVAEAAIPAGLEEAAGRFRSLIHGRRMLIILDNARDAAQVRPLLPGSLGCAVLITSRRRFTSFDGAVQISLDVLPDGEALDLLRAVIGEKAIAAEPAAAAEVVRLCGSLPLALCLAAARLRARPAWSLASLAKRLANTRRRLDELRADDRALRASFQTSYQDLLADSQGRAAARMFRLLGMFDGPDISLSAAAALADLPEERAQDLLDHLADGQLADNYLPDRYRLHDLLRLFARERAEEEDSLPERQRAFRRVLHHFLATVRTITHTLNRGSTWRLDVGPADLVQPGVISLKSQDTKAWIDSEADNILAAVDQATRTPVAGEVVGLATSFAVLLHERGHYLKQFHLAELALVAAEHTSDPFYLAVAHGDLGWAHIYVEHPDDAIRHLHKSRAAFRRAGNTGREAALLDYIGVAHRSAGRYDEAIAHHLRALALVGEAGNRLTHGAVLTHLGLAYQRAGRFAEAVAAHTDTIAILRKAGISAYLGLAVGHLAEAHRLAGDPGRAVAYYQQALDLHREAGPIGELREADILWGLGRALHDADRTPDAHRSWRRSIGIMRGLNLISAEERHALENSEVPETPQAIQRQH
ncbi:BTAD domain-containing putative transcriptional regulator [Nonomuraea angiospora]|uniref:DNA-binding SARP family transcriptional activator/tetratricopeptide (TPR) repeat protein n=1 Tax=Nonomuraea angiospora TaxID=46172 RepID=A0ABR9LR47_9ACTN|nr:AfsR/SARP family transcriptional regulator [Nonomuraea angiospora]MBE1582855.1 DNA-binding SARP family transcriptional activator/tetratricopeptide (TPR) repeat protein [Nonomuraea angiospora]